MTTIKMWLRKKKKKKLKSLTGFISANKIDNYNRGGQKGGKKKEKNADETTEQVKKKRNNKYFCSITAVRVLCLAGSHSPP